MVGFTPNEVPFERSNAEEEADDGFDFEAYRREMLDLRSDTLQSAYEEYDRLHRPF